MNESDSKRWVGTVFLLGAIYLAAGIIFGELAKGAASHPMLVAWRMSAWLTSAIAFGTHIGYEHFRLRHSPTVTALHASLAAALGAFALAASATIHAISSGTGNLHLYLLALVLWPTVTAVPAFLVALAVAAALSRWRRA